MAGRGVKARRITGELYEVVTPAGAFFTTAEKLLEAFGGAEAAGAGWDWLSRLEALKNANGEEVKS
ncbi:hypothetical protein [Ammonifex thiophilus]|uniref:Uncharacterized protein n=1 Tax=Ammonifex thiophilus TaxID=444093 RepID=A0A3D8P1F1_9THEO|nr:hypothetical protein [Ammonifex thiophilus]RDV81255.1 hypothetical protein DXX99_09445 [Ammonifex thiophilus]